jgi:hypothetical protein
MALNECGFGGEEEMVDIIVQRTTPILHKVDDERYPIPTADQGCNQIESKPPP